MAISAGTAIAGAQLGASLLGGGGGGGGVQTQPTSGYATYPQWLKDIYEDTAAPAILETFNRPYQTMPMARYNADPNDPFTSQALLDYQDYSDAVGGLFSPYGPQQGNQAAAQEEAQAAAMADMQKQMATQDWLSRQRASYAPGTDKQRQLNSISDLGALSEALAAYQNQFNYDNPSLENLLTLSSPEIRSRMYG